MAQRKIENSLTQTFANDDAIYDDNFLYAASANDMTGLAPTVAHDEYEAQSYEEVFPYLPPVSPDSDGDVPAASAGIHTKYRTHVTQQKQHDDLI